MAMPVFAVLHTPSQTVFISQTAKLTMTRHDIKTNWNFNTFYVKSMYIPESAVTHILLKIHQQTSCTELHLNVYVDSLL